MTTPESEVNRTNTVRARPGLESRPPVVCDMTGAPDTAAERLAEYARLFDSAYLGRDRDQRGARWLLRADPGVEEWARDLAGRENACCAFMASTVTREGDLVIWHVTTIDDAAANAALDMFYDLPLHRWSEPSQVEDAIGRWSATGVPIITREEGSTRPATAEEIR